MKKLLSLVAVLSLLLVGCGAEVVIEATSVVTTTQAEPETTTQPVEPTQEWAVLTPPLDYEVINGFAKTPTEYFAVYNGGIVCASVDDLTDLIEIPLPDSYEGTKLSGAEICGISERYLYVNMWEARKKITGHDDNGVYYEYENFDYRKCVTFEIRLNDWDAEALAVGLYHHNPTPWYNAASESLLITHKIGDSIVFEARQRYPSKSTLVVPESDWPIYGFWRNTVHGQAVLVVPDDYHEDERSYFIFDRQNQVQLKGYSAMKFPKYADDWRLRAAPKNKAEEALQSKERTIGDYATCGEYAYYTQHDGEKTNFYRVKTDNTGATLLKENTGIFQLVAVGGKLFCHAYHPTKKSAWGSDQIEIYLLDTNGKVVEVLLSYGENREGNSGYGIVPYDGKLMVSAWGAYGPSRLEFLYDPATGAKFPADNNANHQ